MRRSACILLFPLLGPGIAAASEPPGKLIATGWDRPTPARWRRELPAFERLGLFQGAIIQPTRRSGRSEIQTSKAFAAEAWQWDDFRGAVADLNAARSATVTETFLLLNANPGDVDWFDDDGWAKVVDHWRILARVSRLGGLRGLLFDAEPYTPAHQQFNYARQAAMSTHSFVEYATKARDRGRAVMKAVGEERPDCTIMSYRLLCDLLPISTSEGDASERLATHTYGLMPAFVDGWLDVLPPGVRIVEGNENAYSYNSREAFDRAYAELRSSNARLLAPENRAKYRNQIDIGHGLYLDAYTNPAGARWSIDRKGSSPAARLESNLRDASRASDGWVWVNGETGRWWPGGEIKYPSWDEKMPGACAAIFRATTPLAAAAAEIDAADAANLLLDGSFAEADEKRQLKRWWAWQQRDSAGTFCVSGEGRSAEIRGMKNGYLGQNVSVGSGMTYAVGVRARKTGAGFVSASVRWKTADGKWISPEEDDLLTSVGDPDSSGWRRFVALARVPASAAKLVLLLGAEGQWGDGLVEFTDARLVRCRPYP